MAIVNVSKKWLGFLATTATAATLIVFVSAAGVAVAADIAKIGVVDVQRLLGATSVGAEIGEKVKQMKTEFETDLEKRRTEIEQTQKELKRLELVSTKEKNEEGLRRLRIMANDYKKLQNKYAGDFKRQVAQQNRLLEEKIMEIAMEFGRKEGYLFVIDKKRAGVIYASDHIDITDELIRLVQGASD